MKGFESEWVLACCIVVSSHKPDIGRLLISSTSAQL